MNDRKKLQELVGKDDSALLMDVMKQGITRRQMMKMLVAGGMQVGLAGTVATVAGNAWAQTPRKGGRIRVSSATAAVTDSLDPSKGSNQTDYTRVTMFYSALTWLDGSLTPQPALAEEINTKDGITWVFKLRRGVTFHDGKPLTPADVVFSINRHKDPATASKAKSLADQIAECKATGPLEVTMKLVAANMDLPVFLGTYHFHIVKEGTTDFSQGIGTGPYKVKEFKPGVRSIGVRNENYWKPGKAHVDEIEFIGIGDETARINALLSGELDMIGTVNPRSVQRVADAPGYAIFETQAGLYTDLIIRRDTGPGTSPDFVLAMKYMQDREQMRKNITLGHSVVANDQPIDPTNRFYFAGLPQRPFDLDRAKFHLQKANLGSAPLPLVASPAATYSVEMGLILQQTAAKLGLNIDLKRMPSDGYWANHWMKSPFNYGSINPRPNADTLLTQFFKSDAPWNEAGWKNEKFDQVLVQARGETDLAKRTKMYADLQVMIHEGGGIGIPLFLSNIDGHSKKLKGLFPIPLGGLMGYSFAEHVWLEA